MNIQNVKDEVALIEQIKDDNESAHAHEDALYLNVLKTIVSNGLLDIKGAKALAREAIKASKIEFNRWYS